MFKVVVGFFFFFEKVLLLGKIWSFIYKAFMYILLKNLNITSVGTIKKHLIGLGHYFGSITLDINQVFLHMFDIN